MGQESQFEVQATVKLPSISLRLSRKLTVVLAGVIVLTGASGAAAILVGRDAILGPGQENISGAACTAVATVRIRQGDQTWLRKYVRAAVQDGEVRVKTALRVVGALSNDEDADLYQVILLDTAGPLNRADMRGRAIGAEVLFSRNPAEIPGMSAPFLARYVTGKPGVNGEFYGERKELSLVEIRDIVTAMDERSGCADPQGETVSVEQSPEASLDVAANGY